MCAGTKAWVWAETGVKTHSWEKRWQFVQRPSSDWSKPEQRIYHTRQCEFESRDMQCARRDRIAQSSRMASHVIACSYPTHLSPATVSASDCCPLTRRGLGRCGVAHGRPVARVHLRGITFLARTGYIIKLIYSFWVLPLSY